jgi:hypothetical protein
LALLPCSMDFGDEFNHFVVNELIDSSSSDDDGNFYFDAANIVAEASLNESIHRGSLIGHHTIFIFQTTQYLVLNCLRRA